MTFAVIYRTGGTDNFKWVRIGPLERSEAIRTANVITRAGRVAHIENYSLSVSIGLPETYEYSSRQIWPQEVTQS